MPRASRAVKERGHRPRRTPEATAHARETPESADLDLLPALDLGAYSVGSSGLVARHAALLGDTRLHAAGGHLQRVRLLQRLQHGYGNGHVAQVVEVVARMTDGSASGLLQRECEAPPAPKPALEPRQDPRFSAVTGKIKQVSTKEKQHAPPKAKVAEAQAAAQPPANDVATQAEAAQVDKLAQQKPGEFNKAAFIAAVKQAIDAAAPKNLSEAADFKESGKAGQIKGQVSGLVTQGKQESEKSIKTTNQEPPDTSKAKPKPVTPMPADQAGAAPGSVGAQQAIPAPKPADQVSMDYGPCEVKDQMKQANVTEEQLKKSNEPEFTDAVDAKKQAEVNSAKAPQQYRSAERETLSKTGAASNSTASGSLSTMHGTRSAVIGAVTKAKGGTKSQDETKRAEITTKIDGIFQQTKTEVGAILEGLDAKVTTAFDSGEKGARDQFEQLVDQRMRAYKDDRYSGIRGKLRWAKDKLFGMPGEVNAFYQEGRNLYLRLMDGVIGRVADIVGGELGRAKARIAQGKQQVQQFVASQPKELQKIAKEAQSEIGGKFDDLEGEVNSKQDSLVQSLAQKYVSARDALDSRIEDLKAANKGLVDKALDAVIGVIKTILQLKDMLLSVLARAAGVIGTIISDPIGFLGNLVGAIKQGLNQFVDNIGTHLKKGLMGWLFGTLAGAGIQLPDTFDLKGILSLVLQILGVTWANIRARAVSLVGEKVVARLEQVADVFKILVTEGPAGLWRLVIDKIGDFKETIMSQIQDFVITKVITAGITWLLSMLNPASAFIKACKMIYDVVMFFIERGSQIAALVNAILDSISAIAAGGVGAAASLVENALAKAIPVAISFLASLLGLGGLADKIKGIIQAIQGPINRAIDSVVQGVLKGAKFVFGKVKSGVDWAKTKGKQAWNKLRGKDQQAGQPAVDVKALAHTEMAKRTSTPFANYAALQTTVAEVLNQFRPQGLKNLSLRPKEGAAGKFEVFAEASPVTKIDEATVAGATAAEEKGALALYRGYHFKSTLNQPEYDAELRKNLVGSPTFSAAANEIAGQATPAGQDVSVADKLAAAEMVQAELKRTRDPASVRQWWNKKTQNFDSLFLAMFQRYVNTYKAFEKELDPSSGAPISGLLFHKIPFISTSKDPRHAAQYAFGDKILDTSEIRTVGIVGRLLIYLFSAKELQDQGALDVQKLHNPEEAADPNRPLKVHPHIFHEGEVTFSGAIPGENLVAQEDALDSDSVPTLAARGAGAAAQKAQALGGLRKWTS